MIENTNLKNDMKSAHARKFMISPPASLSDIVDAKGVENALEEIGLTKVSEPVSIPLDKIQSPVAEKNGIIGINYYNTSGNYFSVVYKITSDGKFICKNREDDSKYRYAISIAAYNGGYIMTYSSSYSLYNKPTAFCLLDSDLNIIDGSAKEISPSMLRMGTRTTLIGDKAYIFGTDKVGIIDLSKSEDYYSEKTITYPDGETSFTNVPSAQVSDGEKIYFSDVQTSGAYAYKMLTFDGNEFSANITSPIGFSTSYSRFSYIDGELKIITYGYDVSAKYELYRLSNNEISKDTNYDTKYCDGTLYAFPDHNELMILNYNPSQLYQFPTDSRYQEKAIGLLHPAGIVIGKFEYGTKTKLVGYVEKEYYAEV